MAYKYCQHIRENGSFCASGAVKGRAYCYFHLRTRARRLAIAQAGSQQKTWRPELPPLEDMHGVQVALMQVLDGVATESLDPRRAALLLNGLRLAAVNLRAPSAWLLSRPFAPNSIDDRVVAAYPGLEYQFGLPQGIDLDALPEELFPPAEQPEPSSALADANAQAQPSGPRKPPKSVQPETTSQDELLKEA
jgi:hypothetical protein